MTLTVENLVTFLVEAPMFCTLDAEQLKQVVMILSVERFQAGDCVFSEGDVGDAWFVVFDGELAVTKDMPLGPSHEIAYLEPGDIFGEMALLDDSARGAGIHAVSDTTVLRFSREAFEEMLASDNLAAYKLVREMAKVLCRRQREITGILADIVDDSGGAPDEIRNSIAPLLWNAPAWGE